MDDENLVPMLAFVINLKINCDPNFILKKVTKKRPLLKLLKTFKS